MTRAASREIVERDVGAAAPTYSGVNGSTIRRRCSTPSTFSRTNASSTQPSRSRTCRMPATSVASSFGRGCRWTCARRAVSVRRGSITTSFMPRSTARCSWRAGFSPMNCFEMTGLVPTKSQTSASSRRFRPPSHETVHRVGDHDSRAGRSSRPRRTSSTRARATSRPPCHPWWGTRCSTFPCTWRPSSGRDGRRSPTAARRPRRRAARSRSARATRRAASSSCGAGAPGWSGSPAGPVPSGTCNHRTAALRDRRAPRRRVRPRWSRRWGRAPCTTGRSSSP